MTDANDAELSFYCKAYRLADLKRFREFNDELLVDRSADGLKDDDIVFVHPNFCVTHSVFLPRRIERMPTAEWIDFCKSQLQFRVPEDIAEAMSDTAPLPKT
ncbi:MAG: hypothetical protein WB764_27670 [Xanthobacteraceae bacterium]